MIQRATQSRNGLMFAASRCAAVMFAAALWACGSEEAGEEPSDHKGQTIARVNGQEITEHELQMELENLGPLDPEERPAMAREVLRRMIQRAVLAQKAVEKELHRTPEVMTELRRKRANILARAYLADSMTSQLPISDNEIDDFIDQHPNYFARRKHYIFDQLLIDNELVTDEVMTAIEHLNRLEDVAATLKKMNVAFTRRLNANLGSQFPMDAVRRIDALEPGEVFLTQTRDHAVISKLVEARLQPVVGDDARETAKRLLTARRDAAASRKLIETLLASSKIDLLGGFSDMQIFASEPAVDEMSDGEPGEDKPAPDADEPGESGDKDARLMIQPEQQGQ